MIIIIKYVYYNYIMKLKSDFILFQERERNVVISSYL